MRVRVKSIWQNVSKLWSLLAGVIAGELALAGFSSLYDQVNQPGVPAFEPVILYAGGAIVVLRLLTFLIILLRD